VSVFEDFLKVIQRAFKEQVLQLFLVAALVLVVTIIGVVVLAGAGGLRTRDSIL